MTGVALNAVERLVGLLGDYFFGKAFDRFINRTAMKRTVKHILKDDTVFINRAFSPLPVSPSEIEKISAFLIDDVFQNRKYLYPTTSIPEEKESLLWESFVENVSEKAQISISDTDERIFRTQLVNCVNHHNGLIDKYFLDEGDRIIVNAIEKNHSDLLGYIGQTMNSASELQSEEATLDYSHKQLEGVLHALRMDLRHHKLVLLLSLIGLFILSSLSVLIAPKLVQQIDLSRFDSSLAAIMLPLTVFLLFFFILVLVILVERKIILRAEARISRYTESLWELHYSCYEGELLNYKQRQISKDGNCDNLSE